MRDPDVRKVNSMIEDEGNHEGPENCVVLLAFPCCQKKANVVWPLI